MSKKKTPPAICHDPRCEIIPCFALRKGMTCNALQDTAFPKDICSFYKSVEKHIADVRKAYTGYPDLAEEILSDTLPKSASRTRGSKEA